MAVVHRDGGGENVVPALDWTGWMRPGDQFARALRGVPRAICLILIIIVIYLFILQRKFERLRKSVLKGADAESPA